MPIAWVSLCTITKLNTTHGSKTAPHNRSTSQSASSLTRRKSTSFAYTHQMALTQHLEDHLRSLLRELHRGLAHFDLEVHGALLNGHHEKEEHEADESARAELHEQDDEADDDLDRGGPC